MKFKNSYTSYLMMYLFYYLSLALFTVLISVYLLGKGFNGINVSLVVSAGFIVSSLTQPVIGMLNDRFDKKKVSITLLITSSIFALLFLLASNIYLITIFYSLVLSILNGTNPIIEKMATTSRFRYGRIRIWGTIGYALGSQISGLLYDYIMPEAIFFAFILSILLCAVGFWGTKEYIGVEKTKQKVQEKRNFMVFLTNKVFLTYLLISIIFYGISSVAWTYIPPMLMEYGLSANLVGTVIFVATLLELPIVFFSHTFMDKISNKSLLILTLLILVIQYAIYSMVPILSVKIVATLLCKHIAGMLFIMSNLKIISTIVSDTVQNSALTVVSAFRSFSSFVFQNLGGYLVDAYSYEKLYLVLTIIGMLGLVITFFYKLPNKDKKMFS